MLRLSEKFIPVTTILLVLVVVWYAGSIFMNAPFQRDLDRRAGVDARHDRVHRKDVVAAEADDASAASGCTDLFREHIPAQGLEQPQPGLHSS